MADANRNVVYIVGAGLSAGLGFPTIANLLESVWGKIVDDGLDDALGRVIRFHHPDFNISVSGTHPNIERLLSEIQANIQLFRSSRPATGNLSIADLESIRERLLYIIAAHFHEIHRGGCCGTSALVGSLGAKNKI